MATTRPWSHQVTLVRAKEPLDRQHGFAQVVDGRVFYSPNCNRTISTPSSITDAKALNNRISQVQNPHWWNENIPFLPFIPFNPCYTDLVPFQDLSCIHQYDVCSEGKRMPLHVQSQWMKLEDSLIKSTHRLMGDLGVGSQRSSVAPRRGAKPAATEPGILPAQQSDSQGYPEACLAEEWFPPCPGGADPLEDRQQPLFVSLGTVGFACH